MSDFQIHYLRQFNRVIFLKNKISMRAFHFSRFHISEYICFNANPSNGKSLNMYNIFLQIQNIWKAFFARFDLEQNKNHIHRLSIRIIMFIYNLIPCRPARTRRFLPGVGWRACDWRGRLKTRMNYISTAISFYKQKPLCQLTSNIDASRNFDGSTGI